MTEPVKRIRKKRVHVERRGAAQMRANHMEIARNQEGIIQMQWIQEQWLAQMTRLEEEEWNE